MKSAVTDWFERASGRAGKISAAVAADFIPAFLFLIRLYKGRDMIQTKVLFVASFLVFLGIAALAQADEANVSEADKAKFAAFEKLLTQAKLVGRFTVSGQSGGAGKKEEYTISSVKKMPQGDFWLFNARLKYGVTDMTLPLPLEVKWAGETPVITLTETTIPGLGTFSARVVIHGGQYAGIWKHGKHGGQMFGEIQKMEK